MAVSVKAKKTKQFRAKSAKPAKYSPRTLYITAIACMLVSSISEKLGISALNYIFAAISFVIFGIAIRKYFRR